VQGKRHSEEVEDMRRERGAWIVACAVMTHERHSSKPITRFMYCLVGVREKADNVLLSHLHSLLIPSGLYLLLSHVLDTGMTPW
jgi:hypothetical protein